MSTPGALLLRLTRPMRRLRGLTRQLAEVTRASANGWTLYPEAETKKPLQVLVDQARYALRNGETDERYFMYGLDRRGVRPDSVVDYPEFRRIRDRGHAAMRAGGLDYSCVMRDKYLFGLVATALGQPVPKIRAVLVPENGDVIVERLDGSTAPLASLADQDLDAFCKPFDGISSKGVFALRTRNGEFEVNGQRAEIDAVQALVRQRSLLQDRVVQHPELEKLHPSSVNTIRVHTIIEDGRARPFGSILRMGIGGRTADGLGSGGLGVLIDSDTGQLAERGLVRTGDAAGWYRRHPDTGIEFASFQVPLFDEAVSAAVEFHEALPFFHTLGWDMAVTPSGPLFIEGNDNWGGTASFSLVPGFRDVFSALYRPASS